jgi:hypothetical protein
VAEGVVDVFELVQVDEQHRLAVAVCAAQRPLQALAEHDPVGQSGQWIVQGLVGQLVLQRLPCGHRVGELPEGPLETLVPRVSLDGDHSEQ